MKAFTLLVLRVSLGWLMVVWGVDKLVDVEGAQRLAENFYWGLATGAGIQTVFGWLEIALGIVVVVGWMAKVAWPIMALVNGLTLLGVWASVVDPWGFWLERGGSMTFYASAIVFTGILVGWAFTNQDEISVDRWREKRRGDVGGGS